MSYSTAPNSTKKIKVNFGRLPRSPVSKATSSRPMLSKRFRPEKTQMVGLGWLRAGSHQLTTFSCQKIPYCLFWKVLKSQSNLGAILRTANAYGVDAVLCNEPGVDLFNPNVIRTSRGLVFSTKIVIATAQDTVEYLKKHNIAAVATICEEAKLSGHKTSKDQ